MAINWFEGGRRITKLVIAVYALIGGYILFFDFREPSLEFYKASPLDEWHFRVTAEPPEPADACYPSETFWNFEVKPGVFRDIVLCFDPGGKSDAEIATEMAAQADFDITAAREEGYTDPEIIDYVRLLLSRSVIVTFDNGSAYIYTNVPDNVQTDQIENQAHEDFPGRRVTQTTNFEQEIGTFYEGNEGVSEDSERAYTLESTTWWQSEISAFEISPEMLSSVEQNLPQIDRRAMISHLTSVVGTSAAFIASFWMLSFLIGWIVRGFAGIPRGQDFRPSQIDGAKA